MRPCLPCSFHFKKLQFWRGIFGLQWGEKVSPVAWGCSRYSATVIELKKTLGANLNHTPDGTV